MARNATRKNAIDFITLRALDGYRVRQAGEGGFLTRISPREVALKMVYGENLLIMPIGSLSEIRPLDEAERYGEHIAVSLLNTPATAEGAKTFSDKYGPLSICLGGYKEGEPLDAWLFHQRLIRQVVTSRQPKDIGRVLLGVKADVAFDELTQQNRVVFKPEALWEAVVMELAFLGQEGGAVRECASPDCNNMMLVGGGLKRGEYANKTTCSDRCRTALSRSRRLRA